MTKEQILKEAIVDFSIAKGMKRQEAILEYHDMLDDNDIKDLFDSIYIAMENYKKTK